jgi:hypothetical protein
MHLIKTLMSRQLPFVSTSLGPVPYEQASGSDSFNSVPREFNMLTGKIQT